MLTNFMFLSHVNTQACNTVNNMDTRNKVIVHYHSMERAHRTVSEIFVVLQPNSGHGLVFVSNLLRHAVGLHQWRTGPSQGFCCTTKDNRNGSKT
jgi:hypothetical protein